MTEQTVPSTLATTGTIAALTLKRLVRGRALWVSGLIAVMPVVFASLFASSDQAVNIILDNLLAFELLLLAVLPAMFVASSIGEDIEDRTTTYLWSRPVPRWAVLAGKLLALVPVVVALMLVSWTVSLQVGIARFPGVASLAALAAGTTAVCVISAAIATVVPKHGMALTICYVLFFDLPIGVMPGTLKELSVTYQIRVVADVFGRSEGSAAIGAMAIGIIAGVWLVIGLLRVRTLEA